MPFVGRLFDQGTAIPFKRTICILCPSQLFRHALNAEIMKMLPYITGNNLLSQKLP